MGDDFECADFESVDLESVDIDGTETEDYNEDDLSAFMDDVSDSAYDNMYDYITVHNYDQEDYDTYSQDPEWQQLNNDLLEEMGQESVDYSGAETGELTLDDVSETAETLDDAESDEITSETLSDWMDEAEVPDEENMEAEAPDEENMEAEAPGEENMEADALIYDIEHNDEFRDNLITEYPELNDMFEQGEFFQQGLNEYGYEGTCGETTQANTLNRLLDTNEFTENDVLKIAVENDLCYHNPLDLEGSGGTGTEQFMELYDEMNRRTGEQLNVELFDFDQALSVDEMASRIEQGSALNIAVDSCELWGQERDITDDTHYTDHWISVTDVERNGDGDIVGFQIADSGGGESYLDRERFERCYLGPEDDPVMDPTCIVVSKKGK